MSGKIALAMLVFIAVGIGGCNTSQALISKNYTGESRAAVTAVDVRRTIAAPFDPPPAAEQIGESYVLNTLVSPGDPTEFAMRKGSNLVVIDSECVGTQTSTRMISSWHGPSYTSTNTYASGQVHQWGGPTYNVSGYSNSDSTNYGSNSFTFVPTTETVWRHRLRFFRDETRPGIVVAETASGQRGTPIGARP